MRAALDRVRRLEYARGDTTSQDSQESLLWDSAAQNLEDPFDHMRLWSSSAMSSHFDVTVVKSESLSEDMATAGLQISEEDLRDAGPSGLQVEKAHVPASNSDAVGGSVDTVLLVSTDTIVHRNLPTPAPRTSRSNTPVVGGLSVRSHTPLLERRVVTPVASPRRLLQVQDDPPEMSVWTQRVDRILMDAEDQILLYRGARVPPSELATIRANAEKMAAQLRDCHPHCYPAKQWEMADCQKAISEVLVQLPEASHDVELEASSHGVAIAVAHQGAAHHLITTWLLSTTWRIASKPMEVLAPMIIAVDVTSSRLRSLHLPRALVPVRDKLPWVGNLLLSATAKQVDVTTAVTGHETIVVVTGVDAATVAAAVTATVPMIVHIPPLLLLSSLRDKTLCSCWD